MPLEVRQVTHVYPGQDRSVLADVDLVIAAGTTVALMGPSGSGKTTLLMMLGGLLRPSRGSVRLDGEDVHGSHLAPVAFGWVFQTANALGRRTAIDNVAVSLLARGWKHREARSRGAESLRAVGLERLARRPAASLSGGELQRVCIARALAPRPPFILADEPTGQLDTATTSSVMEALFRARTGATSIVLATHDPYVASLCEQVIRIENGRLVPASAP
jgi:putative ABC transport system ATP-binding protein/lipoprotein-releasing system ATP-binding protein